jgi:hypothetical protein
MIITDNKMRVAKIRLAYIVSITTGTILIIYSLFSSNFSDSKLISMVAGMILYLVFSYLLVIKPEYVYFSVTNNKKLTIRNYTAFPLFRKYKAFEIPLGDIHSYEVKKTFFNQIVFIRLLVRKNNKIGKYPWLSLSAASKGEIDKLTSSLEKLLPAESRNKKKQV